MDYKYIKQLLERYWLAQTTLSEENQLRDFFNNEEVPLDLLPYKSLFVYQSSQKTEGLSDDFDQRILAKLDVTEVKARKISLIARMRPLFKAAAMVAVFIMIGGAIQQAVMQNDVIEYDYDSYVDTYDNPEVAYQQVSSALLMISESINKSKSMLLNDSLQPETTERMTE